MAGDLSHPELHAIAAQVSRGSTRDISKLVDQTSSKHLSVKRCSQRWAMKILNLPGFDHIMAFVIVANLIVMITEIDQTANGEVSANADVQWCEYFSWGALFLFVIELLVKLFALRRAFWNDHSNVFDFIIIAVDVSFSMIGLVAGDLFPVSILRIFRLSRLARVSRLVQVFPELKMLLAGFMGSIKAIFWGTLMLFFFLLVSAMMAVDLIDPLNKDIDYGDCERCHRAYSSIANATLTLWQNVITGDAWGDYTIPIIEKHPGAAFFFIPVFLAMGLAMMNLFLGVVVQVAQEAYEEQQRLDEAEMAVQKLQRRSNILQLCQQMDKDNNGCLSFNELYDGFKQPGEFRESILSMGIGDEDFGMAWSLLDSNESGSVDYKEFVTFLCTMNTKSTHFLLEFLKHQISGVKHTVLERLETHQAATVNMCSKLQESIPQVEQSCSKVATGQCVPVPPVTTSASGTDRTQSLKQYFSDDIAKLSMELREILAERNNTFVPLESTLKQSFSDNIARLSMELKEILAERINLFVPLESTLKQSFSDDIARLSMELKEILVERRNSFVPLESTFSTPQHVEMPTFSARAQGRSDLHTQPDLLVVPEKPKCFGKWSICCTSLPDAVPQNSPQSGANLRPQPYVMPSSHKQKH